MFQKIQTKNKCKNVYCYRELLPEDADLLTEVTIDTFGNMCLSAHTHSSMCKKIIRYIKNNAPNAV